MMKPMADGANEYPELLPDGGDTGQSHLAQRQTEPGKASLAIDGILLLAAGVAAVLFSQGIALAATSDVFQRMTANLEGWFLPPQWLVVLLALLPPGIQLGLDVSNLSRRPRRLPCAGNRSRAGQIYAKRVHVCLLALYVDAILMTLCWSASAMPLVSKLFVASMLALAIYAVGQSIPSTRLSFWVSGILLATVLGGTQVFMSTQLRAQEEAAEQQLLQEVGQPPQAPSPPEAASTDAEEPVGDQPIGQTEGRAQKRIRVEPEGAAETPAGN